ncbi:MAG: UDP-N-acetylmuramate dehydrogenase [Spirochaetes bacterium]|nr:UDP-N-acetylmuramate dehydrogenase [Spirochaetota bacterium]
MQKEKLMAVVDFCQKECSAGIEALYDEPLAGRTTFKVGGAADCLLRYAGEDFPAFALRLFARCDAEGIPVFILGGGANIVVSDSGIRGFVLDTSAWRGLIADGDGCRLSFRSGTTLDEAAEAAAAANLSGLEFFAGMPGTVGGAIFMNARCYGSAASDVLVETGVLHFGRGQEPEIKRAAADPAGFGYKKSPFQGGDSLILEATFKLAEGGGEIRAAMERNRRDRQAKGHYLFPCAGSVFKNNRDFGKSTGEIIDALGLCGLKAGGAQVAPFHGNIIVNTGTASAMDIFNLKNEVAAQVKARTGFDLEPEIIFAGDFAG